MSKILKAIGIFIFQASLIFTSLGGFQPSSIKSSQPLVTTDSPVFDYPRNGQTLGYYGSYIFRVYPVAQATTYLWGFFQNGVNVWETQAGNEYGIHPCTTAHNKFAPGSTEVWVRASTNSGWSEAAIITIYLDANGSSQCNSPPTNTPTPRPVSSPSFDYPRNGQTLGYYGSYIFRVYPVAQATTYLWGFFQNGVKVWETQAGNEYGIYPCTTAHNRFAPGSTEVWVRASTNSGWTEAAIITIYLAANSSSQCITPVPQLFDRAELYDRSQSLTVSPGQQIQPWIRIKNSGTTTWRAGQYGYKTEDQWAPIIGYTGKLAHDVAPGEVKEFKNSSPISAPQAPGTYRYGLTLTRPDGSTFGDYYSVQVTVLQLQLTDGAELHSRSESLSVSPGQQIQPWLKIRNSGTTTWRAGQYGYRTEDQWAPIIGSTGKLAHDVAPGEVKEFKNLNPINAPQSPGTYRYGLTLTRPDGSTFGDYYYVQVTVLQPQLIDGAELHSQSEYITVQPGQQIQPWVKIRNSGTTTWRAGQYGYKTEDQWSPNRGPTGKLWRDVAPGDVIEFKDTSPISAPQIPGIYRYGVTLTRPDGSTFGYYFFVQVTVIQPSAPVSCLSSNLAPSGLDASNLLPGDILLGKGDGDIAQTIGQVVAGTYWWHAAIYIGNGEIVHANPSGGGSEDVRIECLQGTSWWEKYVDWTVLRPKASVDIKNAAVEQAKAWANDNSVIYVPGFPGPEFLLKIRRDTDEKTFYCSQLVWKAYEKQGLDLKETDYKIIDTGYLGSAGPHIFWNPISSIYQRVNLITSDNLFYSKHVTRISEKKFSADQSAKASADRQYYMILSPGNLLFIDSSGRKVGYDPVLKTSVNEIPGAYYSGISSHPEVISLPPTQSATNQLLVNGYAVGNYELIGIRINVNQLAGNSIESATKPGQQDNYPIITEPISQNAGVFKPDFSKLRTKIYIPLIAMNVYAPNQPEIVGLFQNAMYLP